MAELKDFNMYASADTGIFKGLNMNAKCSISKNFDKLSTMSKENSISCLGFGDEETEVLIGLRSQTVKVFDVKDKSYCSVFETKAGSGPLVGVGRYDGALITAAESGTVKVWRYNEDISFNPVNTEVLSMGKLKKKEIDWTEEEREKHVENLKIGRKLCRMRQCRYDKKLVGVAGQEVDLQVWDVNCPQDPIFRAKNVRSDFLEMRVPVWVSDLAFLSENTVATCSRYGFIRQYDIRSSQRRPVSDLVWTEKDVNKVCTAMCTVNPNQVVVGTSTGSLGLWDFRNGTGFKGLVRKYRGCTGGIRDIYCPEGKEYFSVAGLDRYIRVYKITDMKPLFNSYLKSKLTGVLMTSEFDPYADQADNERQKNKPGVEEEAPVELENNDDDDDEDVVILSEAEEDDTAETDPTVLVSEAKLENLLCLSESAYKDKAHVFYEFFAATKKQRQTLKATESDIEREKVLNKIRRKFENFQTAYCNPDLKPTKKRKLIE